MMAYNIFLQIHERKEKIRQIKEEKRKEKKKEKKK